MKMKNKEIVRYNQAADLYELGFYETCANLYCDKELVTQSYYDKYIDGLCDDEVKTIFAPTLQQANQWLMENKQWYIHLIPIWTVDTCERFWTVSLYNLDTCQEYCYMYRNQSYYDTMSWGLDRVLDILLKRDTHV